MGTGTDPIGRYKREERYAITDEDELPRALKSGYVKDPDPPKTAKPRLPTHEPEEDERGALRTDRPFTPDEAVAIDAHNRDTYLEARNRRFLPRRRGNLQGQMERP